jgi:hypothetical protein
LLEFSDLYPSGSGESWFEPRRGQLEGPTPLRWIGPFRFCARCYRFSGWVLRWGSSALRCWVLAPASRRSGHVEVVAIAELPALREPALLDLEISSG